MKTVKYVKIKSQSKLGNEATAHIIIKSLVKSRSSVIFNLYQQNKHQKYIMSKIGHWVKRVHKTILGN